VDRSRYGETVVVAALLEELAAVYPDERLGDLATALALRLPARAGMS
jgi:hypothetical protein